MESNKLINMENRILNLEDVLQNNCLFINDQLQKSPSTASDNYFHKTRDYHSHYKRHEELKVPITETSTYGLQSVIPKSTRDWNSLNYKTNIDLAFPELARAKL